MRTSWLALLVIVAASNLSPSAQTQQVEFPEERLQALVGKTARLCGTVVHSSCRLGGDTVLQLWSRPPERGITIRVPASSRAGFERAFEARTLGRDVCATGPISREERRFVVQVDQAVALTIEATKGLPALPSDVVSPCDPNVVTPKLLKQVQPRYTRGAMDRGITGTVELDAIVGTDGRPRIIRIIRSLDRESGLDDEAIKALEQWRFEPGLHEGRPAPTRVVVTLTFTLK